MPSEAEHTIARRTLKALLQRIGKLWYFPVVRRPSSYAGIGLQHIEVGAPTYFASMTSILIFGRKATSLDCLLSIDERPAKPGIIFNFLRGCMEQRLLSLCSFPEFIGIRGLFALAPSIILSHRHIVFQDTVNSGVV